MIDLKFLFENLFINKYDLKYSKRISSNTLLVQASKRDEFGKLHDYDFYFFTEKVDDEYILKFKTDNSFNRILIAKEKNALADFSIDEFWDKLQILIDPGIYLRKDITEILDQLGHNMLPTGFVGDPSDLFEIYSKESLQFILGGRGRRYGKERSFESVPDGAVISVKRLSVLFDAKAYKEGYNVSADEVKRYESYVNDFNDKYSMFTNRIFSFVVVSGHFTVGEEALAERTKEMYSRCQTILTFISASELGESIKFLNDNAVMIDSIDWKKILVNPVYKIKHLQDSVKKIAKDKIL
jgi:hypothetical protein